MGRTRQFVAVVGLILSLFLPNSGMAQSDEYASLEQFLGWWEDSLWTGLRNHFPDGVVAERYPLESLMAYEGEIDLPEVASAWDSVQVLALTSDSSRTWVLAIPWANPEVMEEWDQCVVWRSFLVPSDGGRPLEIKLSPYCNEVYDSRDVDFVVYHVRGLADPLVEMMTNGPACVPAHLYGYSPEDAAFEIVRESCGG